MEVLITFHIKVFLGNKYNSYIHTAQNAKVTSTRIIYETTVMKLKVFKGVFRTQSNIYSKKFYANVRIDVAPPLPLFAYVCILMDSPPPRPPLLSANVIIEWPLCLSTPKDAQETEYTWALI